MRGNGSTVSKKSRVAKTATEALKVLWESGFFKSWKKNLQLLRVLAREAITFLTQNSGWPCSGQVT